jgi:hypothetical protein
MYQQAGQQEHPRCRLRHCDAKQAKRLRVGRNRALDGRDLVAPQGWSFGRDEHFGLPTFGGGSRKPFFSRVTDKSIYDASGAGGAGRLDAVLTLAAAVPEFNRSVVSDRVVCQHTIKRFYSGHIEHRLVRELVDGDEVVGRDQRTVKTIAL